MSWLISLHVSWSLPGSFCSSFPCWGMQWSGCWTILHVVSQCQIHTFQHTRCLQTPSGDQYCFATTLSHTGMHLQTMSYRWDPCHEVPGRIPVWGYVDPRYQRGGYAPYKNNWGLLFPNQLDCWMLLGFKAHTSGNKRQSKRILGCHVSSDERGCSTIQLPPMATTARMRSATLSRVAKLVSAKGLWEVQHLDKKGANNFIDDLWNT